MLMIRLPPRSKPTHTRFPYTTLVRAHEALGRRGSHPARKPLAHAPDRGHRELRVGVAKARIVGGHDQIARQSDFQSAGITMSVHRRDRSDEHTSELQSLMRNSYAVFCLQKIQTHIKL